MEEPGGLQSMGSQRVWHNWVTSFSLKKKTNKQLFTIWSCHSISRYLSKRKRNKCLQGDFYTKIHRNFICNSKKLTTYQIPLNKWMDKQSVIQPSNGILQEIKRINYWLDVATWMDLKIIMLSERSQRKGAHTVDSIYIKFKKIETNL